MISNQNTYAIIGMLAIVITLYALHNAHQHYLPDLFGLALAFTAPRQSMAIGAVVVLALIRHSHLAHGLASGVPDWLLPLLLPGARNMSISGEESSELESAYDNRISERESNNEMAEIPQPVAEIPHEITSFVQSRLLAKLVISGEVGLTKAIQIGAGAQSGAKYQRMSRLVKMEIDRLQNHYPSSSTLKRYD